MNPRGREVELEGGNLMGRNNINVIYSSIKLTNLQNNVPLHPKWKA